MILSEQLSYLFANNSLVALRSFIDRNTLFAFDLDGTLAPIATDPGSIAIPDEIKKEFSILNKSAVVAVITGRSRQDALAHLGLSPRYLIGNHGAEGLPGCKEREIEFIIMTSQWQQQLDVFLPIKDRAGMLIENKGATLSIHYRRAANIELAHNLILNAISQLVPQPRRIGGKLIESLIPANAPDKGAALRLLMHQAGCGKGFFTGDDETDEDVFRLNNDNIFTVRVGRKTDNKAQFYLEEQNEMIQLLREINKSISELKKRNAKAQS